MQKSQKSQIEVKELIRRAEQLKGRSAWEKGVNQYVIDIINFATRDYPELLPEGVGYINLEAFCLGGAQDWEEASRSGDYLIYNGDIAARLCTASELKRTKGGMLPPNGRESWIDTQAMALTQAMRKLEDIYLQVCKENKENKEARR